MACDICLRAYHTKDLGFLCTIDARNRLYPPRLTYAQLLLENDSLKAQVVAADSPTSTSALEAQRITLDEESTRIFATASKLRSEIAAARAEIRERREVLEKRRERLGEVRDGIVEARKGEKEDVERAMRVSKLKWAQVAEESARYRAFLCQESARLYGLKKVKTSGGGASNGAGGGKYGYYLGRLPVVDLTNMNALTPETISTSLAHICHILILASHYLSVRLPAEVVLPHRDHPRPTIFTLVSSYQPRPSAKSRSTSRSTSSTSLSNPGHASSSQGGGDSPSRPRPLFIDKPLTQLAKEDSVTYAYFLEGVTLLAYNVAWLCCSQGVKVVEKDSFEDVCQMGRNLNNLLITRHVLPTPSPTPATPAQGEETQQQQQQGDKAITLGRYSHGSTYYSLVSSEGTELIRGFKLPSPMKLVDKLKRKLMGDAPDWEVVDDDAWRMDGAEEARNATSEQQDGTARGSPKAEYQGWLRVKSRG